jgi:hypothetical protein
LSEEECDLLAAYAKQLGHPPTRVAGDLLRKVLYAEGGPEAVLRLLKGNAEELGERQPIWEWPIEAILAQPRWWDRWLPDLDELLGRSLTNPKDPQGRREVVKDRRGYADLMEFLFPAVATASGTVTWRSPEYPRLVKLTRKGEEGEDAYHLWESVIRHVATAVEALSTLAAPQTPATTRILIQEQISGPWLRTLKSLLGEGPPKTNLPLERLT